MNGCRAEHLDWLKCHICFFYTAQTETKDLKSKPDWFPKVYNQITSVVSKQPDHSTVLITDMCLKVLRSSQ